MFDPQKGTYVRVPAVDEAYAKGLSLWQHRVIRRYAQRQLNMRTDIVALAQAKAEIRALVERDFNRKSTRGRKRHARFMEDHASASSSERVASQPALAVRSWWGVCGSSGDASACSRRAEKGQHRLGARSGSDRMAGRSDAFTDDEILPVFEAALDLPRIASLRAVSARYPPAMEKLMTESMDPSERVLVKYPLFKSAVARIQACFDSYGTTAEPDCCPIVGESGSGKTTIISYFASLHPRVDHKWGMEVPVLVAKVPARPNREKLRRDPALSTWRSVLGTRQYCEQEHPPARTAQALPCASPGAR